MNSVKSFLELTDTQIFGFLPSSSLERLMKIISLVTIFTIQKCLKSLIVVRGVWHSLQFGLRKCFPWFSPGYPCLRDPCVWYTTSAWQRIQGRLQYSHINCIGQECLKAKSTITDIRWSWRFRLSVRLNSCTISRYNYCPCKFNMQHQFSSRNIFTVSQVIDGAAVVTDSTKNTCRNRACVSGKILLNNSLETWCLSSTEWN